MIIDHLQDIPNRAQDIAGHGVRHGAAVALVVVQSQLGHDLRGFQLVIPEGEDHDDLEKLVLEFDEAAGAISVEVDIAGVVSRVFLGD